MLMYSPAVYERAQRAWRCSPFQLALFKAMSLQGIPLAQICGESGIQQGYTWQRLSELEADRELFWLIQVGLLRREVDGQGITDSYRLAPLGRQILDQSDLSTPTLWDQSLNRLARWGWVR